MKKNSLFGLVITLLSLFIGSCKKSNTVELLTPLQKLQSLKDLSQQFKSSLNTKNLKFSENEKGDKLWITSLRSGSFNLNTNKTIIIIKDGKINVEIIGYSYNTSEYNKKDTSTYTGTTTYYRFENPDRLITIATHIFKKGKLIRAVMGEINNQDVVPFTSICDICPPPPPQPPVNWCSVLPFLCELNNGSGSYREFSYPSDETDAVDQMASEGGGGGYTNEEIGGVIVDELKLGYQIVIQI